jgi:hypothetical protein
MMPRAVVKKSDNNVVSEALQAKWMDYSDIGSGTGSGKWQRTRQPGRSKELVILAMC